MINYIKNLFFKFNTWRNEYKQPLTREDAYALTSTGTKGNCSKVVTKFIDDILDDIKVTSKNGYFYLLKDFPTELSSRARDLVVEALEKLKYTICYRDNNIIVISWLYSLTDYNNEFGDID